jgi:NADH dehydrogenase/NADH:ubiquinone oxidoreductase subunit G
MKVKIDENYYDGIPGETLIELAKRNNILIPSLCHKSGLAGQGRCRLCIVEVTENNKTKIVSSCVFPIKDGIEVSTKSENIIKMRKNIILLLLLRTPNSEYIKNLAKEYDVVPPARYAKINSTENCILCGLCVKACEAMGTNAISFVNRGTTKAVSTPYDDASKDCIGCGSCADVCPTGNISLVDKGNERSIQNKKFNLVPCSRCGKYYTTKQAIAYVNKKLKTEEEPLCDSCKRKIIGERFKESFQNIY